MRTALAVLAGRLVRVLARARGGGSAMPGRVALLIAPRFLGRAVERLPLGVVFVSGSNGKSTTTHMLVRVLRAHGVRVFTNPSGANLPQGVASALLAEAPLSGRLDADIAVLEVDEAYGPRLASVLQPHSVLLVNVQVDQLNRFHEPDRVVRMLAAIAEKATRHLVVNGDDHNLVRLAAGARGGAALAAFRLDPSLLADSPWLARGDNPALADRGAASTLPDTIRVTESSGATATLVVDEAPLSVVLPARGLHYAADAAAAVAMAHELLGDRFRPAEAATGLASMQAVYGRGEVLRAGPGADAEQIELLMMKNPPSLQVNLDAIAEPPEQLFVAVDEGTPDPSWIYGTDFAAIDHVDVLTGTKCWQLATRFAYGDIPVASVEPDLTRALAAFLALPTPAHGRKTILVNYEQMMLIRRQLGHLELEGAA
ncbi:Mur ligase family protein [uncultured Amnibacterium sp.]|uniref:Mur ligase family protein n=1 Tax=uncultured Amnibacterium sp. TaxID=1631851 RepID=UPI0035CBE61C